MSVSLNILFGQKTLEGIDDQRLWLSVVAKCKALTNINHLKMLENT
jgi:hypothetical protein